MSNKKTIYVLLPLVLILWGYIIYRVLEQANPDVDLPNSELPAIRSKLASDITDDFSLLLNYPDPFLKHLRIEENGALENTPENSQMNQVYVWNWPNMTYGGCIVNKKKIVGILQINSKNLLVQEGKEYEDFKVDKIYSDSIVMKREDMKRTFIKNN